MYDLGGGTFDAAVVSSNGDGTFDTIGQPGGVDPLGGVDFDFALLGIVGETISERDPQLWDSLVRPTDTTGRRRRRALLDQVKSLKEDLSRSAQSTLLVPETDLEVTVTRDEFTVKIRPFIDRSAGVLAETIATAQSTPHGLAAVYLVGGSSRIPLVAEVISERLGVDTATLDEPKQVVAFGAVTHIAAHAAQIQAEAPGPPRLSPRPTRKLTNRPHPPRISRQGRFHHPRLRELRPARAPTTPPRPHPRPDLARSSSGYS